MRATCLDRVQEQRLGKVGREMRKLLDHLAKGGGEAVRHLKVGTVMVREHRGTLHEVMQVSRNRCAAPSTRANRPNITSTSPSTHSMPNARPVRPTSRARLMRAGGFCPIAMTMAGLSGASLERPALQHLLDRGPEGRVDVIVVYKVDRLTRSLADFAKLVETLRRA